MPEPFADPAPPRRTRLQEIALDYVERYWARLHTADRLAIVRQALTAQERQWLREELHQEDRA
jgi:hypothetical protein